MALLGVISGPQGRRALLRLPSGAVRRVSEGQEVDCWRVSAIDDVSVRIIDAGRVRTLTMP
jgi:ribosomal protein L2